MKVKNVRDNIKKIINLFLNIPRVTVIEFVVLILILVGAMLLRLLPLRWGLFLSEFDPYQQFRMTQHIVDNGFYSWFSWHDDMSWHPWGRYAPTTNYPGLAFTAAFLYMFVSDLGFTISLYDFTIIFPVIFGAASCLAMYLFGRTLWSRGTALFASLFLAFNAAFISRTSLGFFDDETVGILTMLLTFTFFIKSVSNDRSQRASVIYGILSGLSIAYLAASWGAFRYPLALLALYTLILIILKRSSPRLLLAYSLTLGVGIGLMIQIPNLGYAFIREWPMVAIIGTFIILLFVELVKFKPPKKNVLMLGFIISIIILGSLSFQLGLLKPLAGKFSTILNPSTRLDMPLVESVAEHRPATWASFFYEFGVFIFLGIFGLYYVTKKLKDTDIFLILFALTSMYFASSFVRLTMIMAPIFALLASIAITELGRPAIDVLREMVIFPKKRIRLTRRVGREFGISIILILLIIVMPTFYYAVRSAYAPTTLATSSIPVAPTGTEAYRYQDWVNTLVWMNDNLPEDSVVFSWWDYGYWITALGEKKSMADNGTLNSTQIAVIACTFLSNETRAIPILKSYDVTHIAIFVTWTLDEEGNPRFYGYGEDNKWYWMARIGNGTTILGEKYNFYQEEIEQESKFYRVITSGGNIISNDTIADRNGINDSTILGEMIYHGIGQRTDDLNFFKNVFSSSNRYVLLYEVQYLDKPLLTLNLDKEEVNYGDEIYVSGKLLKSDGQGLENQNLIIEYSIDGGIRWTEILDINTGFNGTYIASFGLNSGNYSLRAMWPGISTKFLRAESLIRNLTVNPVNLTLNLDLSMDKISLNETVQINSTLSEPINEGNITLQYRKAGEEWMILSSIRPINGTSSITWAPTEEGLYDIRSYWYGENYYPAVSKIKVLRVD